MNKIMIVAGREFYETVKSKMFIISSLLVPVLIMGTTFASKYLIEAAEKEEQPDRDIAVIDATDGFGEVLVAAGAAYNEQNPQRKLVFELQEGDPEAAKESATAKINAGALYAYVFLPAELLDVGGPAPELGRKDSNIEVRRTIESLIERAVVAARFEGEPGLDYGRVQQLQSSPGLREIDVASGRDTTDAVFANIMTPFAFMFLLFMGTMNISQGLLTSLIEEKSSRIVEVLLSAVSPMQLLAGKIIGMVAVGMLLMAIWGGVGYYAAAKNDMEYLVSTDRLLYLALYFVPGFLFVSAALAAVGSACNTLKDAQGLAFPLTITTIVPLMLWYVIVSNPHSAISIVLSFIPPITPYIMVLRICADPEIPMWQIVSTLVLLWATVLATVWLGAKIFRVGVLMYGKAPTPIELLRWIRYA